MDHVIQLSRANPLNLFNRNAIPFQQHVSYIDFAVNDTTSYGSGRLSRISYSIAASSSPMRVASTQGAFGPSTDYALIRMFNYLFRYRAIETSLLHLWYCTWSSARLN